MAAPSIPQNFVVQQANGDVWLTWNQITSATYVVHRSTDNITYSLLASPTVPEYLDTTAVLGTQYWYKVASTNGTQSAFTLALSVVPVSQSVMTLGQLRLLSQQKADRVNSNFVTVDEWNTYINQSYFELYDLLVQKYGNEYFVAPPYQFSTTGAQFYDLPENFYKLLGVDLCMNGSQPSWITLKKFQFISRNRYVYPQITTNLLGIAGLRYRLMGNQLELIPSPAGGQTLQLWYVPKLDKLLRDIDQCDGVSGWTEYIAVDAAIKALQKEESDVSILAAQKLMLIQRIEAAAENRDAGEPEVISDTRRYTDLYGTGFGGVDGPNGGM